MKKSELNLSILKDLNWFREEFRKIILLDRQIGNFQFSCGIQSKNTVKLNDLTDLFSFHTFNHHLLRKISNQNFIFSSFTCEIFFMFMFENHNFSLGIGNKVVVFLN